MMAAINGEPFDMYPFTNPHPWWSMMPHWPEMLGLTWLHVYHGTDEERIRCHGAFHEVLGLDWIRVPMGATGQDKRYRIKTEDGVPVLVDIIENTRQRHDEFPRDEPISEPIYTSLKEVGCCPCRLRINQSGFTIQYKRPKSLSLPFQKPKQLADLP